MAEPVSPLQPDAAFQAHAAPSRARRSLPLRVVPPSGDLPDLRQAPEGRWLELAGRGRTWIREEAGPAGARPLLMLHGLSATGGLNWAGSQFALRDRFRMITIDHRGHGRGIRTRNFRLEDCADDAAACIDALRLDRPIVVGYSMGGPIASLLWRRHPDLVGGLVLCATSRNFRGSPGEKLTFGAMALAGLSPVALPKRLVRSCSSLLGSVPLPHLGPADDLRFALDELAGHDPRSIVQAGAAIGRFNSSAWIGRVDVPTSVVVTTGDQIVPPIRQLRMARSIPDATTHCVDVGHLCVAGGAPKERFLAALRRACFDVADA